MRSQSLETRCLKCKPKQLQRYIGHSLISGNSYNVTLSAAEDSRHYTIRLLRKSLFPAEESLKGLK